MGKTLKVLGRAHVLYEVWHTGLSLCGVGLISQLVCIFCILS